MLVPCHTKALKANELFRQKTTYTKGLFHSYAQIKAHADGATAHAVVNDFIDQFRGDPNLLFEWALKGLGRQGEGEKDAITLHLKSTTFDKQTNIGVIKTDIEVQGFRTFKDISIESKVVKRTDSSGKTTVDVEVFYSNFVLRKAYGAFYITPLSEKEVLLSVEMFVRFGWFFDLFITQKRYCNLSEFRIEGFLRNMKSESERRMDRKRGSR